MKSLTAGMTAHIARRVTTLCTCWRVERTDGVVFGFTDHDVNIVYDGVTYVAESGFSRSAISNSASTTTDGLEAQGFLDEAALTDVDLRAGRFDYAEVELFMLNWENTSHGQIKLRKGHFGEVVVTSSGQFSVEMRGLAQQLSQSVGRSYMASCDADLGDARCTVPIAPEERKALKDYKLGDRVITLDTATKASAIPLANGSFGSVADLTTIPGWTLVNMKVVPRDPTVIDGFLVDSWGLNPIAWDCSLESAVEEIKTYPAGVSTPAPGAVQGGIGAVVNLRHYVGTTGSTCPWQVKILMKFFDATLVEVAQRETAWLPLGFAVLPQNLGDAISPLPASPVITHSSVKVTMRRAPASLAVIEDQPLSILASGTYVAGATNQFYNTNSRIETTASSQFTLSGWNSLGFAYAYTQRSGVLAKEAGGRFLAWSNDTAAGPYFIWTDCIPLVGLAGLTTVDLDSGLYVVDLEYLQATSGLVGQGRAYVVFYTSDASTNYLTNRVFPASGAEVPDWHRPYVYYEWEARKRTYEIPAGARFVRIWVEARQDPNALVSTFNGIDQCFDELKASVKPVTNTAVNYVLSGGVEYEVQIAGVTSALSQVGFSRVLGAAIADGSITWQAVAPKYLHLGDVATVSNRGGFTVIGAGAFADTFFNRGQVRFLTGPAAGVNREIYSHVGTSITLRRPSPVLPLVGDKVLLVVGCDKRITTCKTKFGNHLNFRGFPRIPGTNMYFKVGTPRG